MGLLDRLLGQSPMPGPSGPLSYAVLDVETTGLSPRQDRILEIAIVRLAADGRPIDEWNTRLDPQGPVGATHIHGITQSDVDGKPLFSSLAPTLAELLGSLPVVAHNASFDLAFLRGEFGRAGWDMPWISTFCTLGGSYDYFPGLDRRRLSDCCWAAGVRHDQAHSALGDARATAALFGRYLAHDPNLPARAGLGGAVTWPLGPVREAAEWIPRSGNQRPQRISAGLPSGPPLVRQLSSLTLTEVLDEGAPVGSLVYLETLLSALEDGELSTDESERLTSLAEAYALSETELSETHVAFMLALAHRALDDGHVSRDERQELHQLASLIGVPADVVPGVIARADAARSERMSAGLKPLPEDWQHGDPLRVGDKVVFTGGDEAQRLRLEQRAESLGVRVVGGVSRQTSMLVTDGEFQGTKAAKAAELGTRIVHPDSFELLLIHLQPTLPTTRPTASAKPDATAVSTSRMPPASSQTGARGASPSIVRAWALRNGMDVGTRGRLHSDVFDAYWASQTQSSDTA